MVIARRHSSVEIHRAEARGQGTGWARCTGRIRHRARAPSRRRGAVVRPRLRGSYTLQAQKARAAARLSGPLHVITVLPSISEHEERPFIVMEYLEGGSLHEQAVCLAIEPHGEGARLAGTGSPTPSIPPTVAAWRGGGSSRPTCCSTAAGACRCSTFGIASAAGSDALHASRHRARNGRLSVAGAGTGRARHIGPASYGWASSRSSC